MKKALKGTYWLVNIHGNRWITQGNKPVKTKNSCTRSGEGMGWLNLDDEPVFQQKDGEIISSMDFKELSFPEVKEDDEPLEIEISKSGKIYSY